MNLSGRTINLFTTRRAVYQQSEGAEMLIRAVFVLAPALLFAVPMCVIHPFCGVATFLFIAAVGCDATKAHPERGEPW